MRKPTKVFAITLGAAAMAGAVAAAVLLSLGGNTPQRALGAGASGCYDIDGDGIVHMIDVVIVSDHYGETVPPGPPQVDVAKNGVVDLFNDIFAVLSAFENTTSCQASPLSKTAAAGGALAVDGDPAVDPVQSKGYALVGTPFQVTVNMTQNPGTAGYQFRLHWDEALLDLTPRDAYQNDLWSEANNSSCLLAMQKLGPADNDVGSESYIELGGMFSVPSTNCPASSAYVGPVAQLEFTCQTKGTANLTLTDAGTHTALVARPATEYTPTLANAQINCVNILPTPTPTPTPTPKPPLPGPKLVLDAKTSGCAPTTFSCDVLISSGLVTVTVRLAEIDLPDYDGDTQAGYLGFQARLDYDPGLALAPRPGTSEIVWPSCSSGAAAEFEQSGRYTAGCSVLFGAQESTFLGPLLEVDFSCYQEGSFPIDLVPASPGGTGLVDEAGNPALSDKPDSLVINCIAPDPSLDSDGDGCNDAEELGGNQEQGGLRNPNNFWDFYDTNLDRGIDLFFDIFPVAYRYGATDDTNHDGTPDTPINRNSDPINTSIPPAPDYHPRFDRSSPPQGGDLWDLGPANGTIDLFVDIFGVAFQYGHHCAGPA